MTATDQQNVVDLLVDQHQQVKQLANQVKTQSGTAKRDSFEELVRLLAVHEAAEEEVVHPKAKGAIDNGDRIVEERLHEEDEAKHVLAELYRMGVDHPEFDPKFAKLADAVTQHAEQEENQEFRILRERMDQTELVRMSGAVRAAEASAPTRPHPHAGESATANLVAGPPLALFDRLRDAVRDWTRR